MTCPVCGQRVEIQTGDEGTSSFVPTAEREVKMLREANARLRLALEDVSRISRQALQGEEKS